MAQDNQDKDERELEEYLQGDSTLSKDYQRASAEMPPTYLDEAIMATSRKSAKSRPRLAFSPFSSDWHVPVSLAAVLALCVTLVVTMQEDVKEPLFDVVEIYPLELSKNDAVQEQGETQALLRQVKSPAFTTAPAMDRVAPARRESKIIMQEGDVKREPMVRAREINAPEVAMELIVKPKPAELNKMVMRDEMASLRSQPDIQRLDTPRETFSPQSPPPIEMELAQEEIRQGSSAMVMQQEKVAGGVAPAKKQMLRSRTVAGITAMQNEAADTMAGFAEAPQTRKDVRKGDIKSLIENLTGNWDGEAVTTPIGPANYDITFERISEKCISGTAHPGSDHNWTFCDEGETVKLDFLTNFQGNHTPIHFKQVSYNAKVYTFKADSHDFMEVQILNNAEQGWMKIYHHKKLHVEIHLIRN